MIKIFNCDCREILDQLPDNTCIVTDPPFNIGYKYNTYCDKMSEEDYFEFLSNIFIYRNFPFVVVHYPEQLYKLSFKVGMFPEKVVSWCYNANTKKQHRDIAYFGVMPDFSRVKQPYKNPNDKRIKKLIESGKTGTDLYDWWFINQVKNVSKEKTAHPCQMPLEVMKNAVGIIPDGYTIFDPFLGSGTTAAACKELGYDFIGTEIDKEYFQISSDRLKE